MKSVLISTLVFVGLLVVAGLLVEWSASEQQHKIRYYRTRSVFQYDRSNVVFDPVLGYRLAPNLNKPFHNVEFKTLVRTNSLGFRDDDKSLANPDVLFLGDSYVFGWGVEEENGVEKRFEKLTGKSVLNMGVPGYSNIQELMMLFKWSDAAKHYAHDIYLFFSTNDLIDNQNTSFGAFPCFEKVNGQLGLRKPSEEGYRTWLDVVDSWTVRSRFAETNMLAYYLAAALKGGSSDDIYQQDTTDEKTVKGNKAFVLVVQQLADFALEHNSKVNVVYIPSLSESANKHLPFVENVCRKMGLGFVNLSSILSADDYFSLDMHWRESGHRKVAELLSRGF